MNKKISNYIKKDKCKKILERLVKINTVNPPGNEMDIVKEIESIFSSQVGNIDYSYKVLEHGNNRGSLFLTVPGKNSNKGIAFLGHIDTVPVDNFDEWKYPPFAAHTDQFDTMYGRGTADMKGGVTAMIIAALFLLENNITPSFDIHFVFTADEESGGLGVTEVRDEGLLNKVKRIFICEPTDEMLGIAEKGALWLNISAKGKSAHGSMPEEGVNAVERLITYISYLKNEIISDEKHPLLGKSTMSINEFEGGIKTNIIPEKAHAAVDIRTVPGYDHQKIIKLAHKLAEDVNNKIPFLQINVEVENNRPPLEIDRDHLFIKELEKIYTDLNYNFDYKGINFYTDASQVIPYIDIPFVILGPGEEGIVHQMNEKINLNAIVKVAKIYLNYILDI